MRIGFVGLGKLGLPVAVAMAMRGHDVLGYDVNASRLNHEPKPEMETGPDGVEPFAPYLANSKLRFAHNLEDVVDHAEILFCAIQTPHEERFDGSRVIKDDPVDFDYAFLKAAVRNVVKAKLSPAPLPFVVISTVLPGTMEREVKPLLNEGLMLVYNPFFIAMGTVMKDFLNPEFVLLGVDDSFAAELVWSFYRSTLPDARVAKMSVPSAELTKVLYNTFISTKIALANTAMEICHKTPGANVDDVTGALKAATHRIASGAYLDAGMGDGGGCHPRDNIALMWYAKKTDLSTNPFGHAMRDREMQSEWLAKLVLKTRLPIVIAGYAFKPGTNITTGSPALLLHSQLGEWRNSTLWDPHVDASHGSFPYRNSQPEVVVLGCRHPEFIGWNGVSLAPGSVIIDPHRITAKRGAPGVEIVHVGVGK